MTQSSALSMRRWLTAPAALGRLSPVAISRPRSRARPSGFGRKRPFSPSLREYCRKGNRISLGARWLLCAQQSNARAPTTTTRGRLGQSSCWASTLRVRLSTRRQCKRGRSGASHRATFEQNTLRDLGIDTQLSRRFNSHCPAKRDRNCRGQIDMHGSQ